MGCHIQTSEVERLRLRWRSSFHQLVGLRRNGCENFSSELVIKWNTVEQTETDCWWHYSFHFSFFFPLCFLFYPFLESRGLPRYHGVGMRRQMLDRCGSVDRVAVVMPHLFLRDLVDYGQAGDCKTCFRCWGAQGWKYIPKVASPV